MNTITLNETLLNHFKIIADQRHTPIEGIISQVLEDYLENYFDVLAAEEVLAKIKSGEEKVFSWEDVKAGLYDMES